MIQLLEFDHVIDVASQRGGAELRDALDRRVVASLLARRLLEAQGRVIGVYGTWGSGKSFVLDLTIDELFQDSGRSRPIVCHFQPWRYEPDTSLAPGLITALQSVNEQFPQRNPDLSLSAVKDVRQLGRHLKQMMRQAVGWLNTTADITLSGVAQLPAGTFVGQEIVGATAAVAKAATARASATDSGSSVGSQEVVGWDPRSIKLEMTRLIEELRRVASQAENRAVEDYQVVVIIDDLDRCAPNLLVDMLNWLKVHLEVPGCSYLLALDHEAAARAIVGRYRAYLGDAADVAYGLRYLEKIVSFEVELGKSSLVEAMATRSVTEGAAASVVEVVDLKLGRQGTRATDISRLMRLPTLQSPRTMLKVVERFVEALGQVERQQEDRLQRGTGGAQLPGDYAFWLLLLTGMYYRLAPGDIEAFCDGYGRLLEADTPDAPTRTRATEPVREFRDFIRSLAGGPDGRTTPGAAVLAQLYSVVRQLAVS